MNILELAKSKGEQKTSWITCYDYSSAKIVAASPIDGVLVGDSVAMTIYGYPNTLHATVEMIAQHTQAVANGLAHSNKFIVADLPFPIIRQSMDSILDACSAFLRSGAHAVKIEGLRGHEDKIHHLVQSGIPVMGHLGLTPQSFNQLGGFKVQGKSPNQAQDIVEDAKALQQCGAFALVLECVPQSLGKSITESISVPTIGIGAGPYTDGQILVWQDLLGYPSAHQPRFVKKFANTQDSALVALTSYHEQIQSGQFPSPQESYS